MKTTALRSANSSITAFIRPGSSNSGNACLTAALYSLNSSSIFRQRDAMFVPEQLIKQIGNLSNNRTGGLLRVILGGGSFGFKFPFKILFRAGGKSSVQFPDNIPTFRHVNEYAVTIGKRKHCFAVRGAGRRNRSASGKSQNVVHVVPSKLDCVNL